MLSNARGEERSGGRARAKSCEFHSSRDFRLGLPLALPETLLPKLTL